MVMDFKTRKKDKRVFPVNRETPPRSNIAPQVVAQPTGISSRFRQFKERLRLRRETRGMERIRREERALEQERIQASRLEEEARIEQERENITEKRIAAQERLRGVSRSRRQRRFAPITRRARQAFEAGRAATEFALAGEPAPPPRRPRRKARRAPREEFGPFGIKL